MVIINGAINSEKGELLDSGFYFGLGVFETMMVTDKPLFLQQHINRLNSGLRRLGINKSLEIGYILECIREHKLYHCVLKVVVTEENIIVTTRQSHYKTEDYNRGFKLKVTDLRRNPYSHVTYVKSLNYSDNLIEMKKAKAEGFDEVLFLNTDDKVAEGSVSNIFFTKRDRIFTPKIQCGILDGIVRGWVINNFSVEEGCFSLEDILEADEVFITNSIIGIIKVISINDKKYCSGAAVKAISDSYKEYINKS
jgi:4-amino-4-deoxychorismate lyase